MTSQPSFYFDIVKKLQLLAHAYDGTLHVDGNAQSGFNIDDGSLPSIRTNWLNPGSMTATNTALYNVLDAKRLGNATVAAGLAGAGSHAMPQDAQAGDPWDVFQTLATSPNRLLDVFGAWIAAGSPDDTAVGAIRPGSTISPTDPGVKVFVRNDTTDEGTSPLPADWWAHAQIFLVSPNGSLFSGSSLQATDDLYLVAVVGNRGSSNAGRWQASVLTAQPTGTSFLAQAWVAVWNCGFSPGVLLPALSNLHFDPNILDPDSLNDEYEEYVLEPGTYDLVGFRLRVQDVFDGLVQELVNSGIDLGAPVGTTPKDAATAWLEDPAHNAHVCTQVRVRGDSALQDYPPFGHSLDTLPSDQQHRIAQKNLIPFNTSLTAIADDQPINFWSFVTGCMIMMTGIDLSEMFSWIRIEMEDFAYPRFRRFIAIPERPFAMWVRDEDQLEGLRVVKGFTSKRGPESIALTSFQKRLLKQDFEFGLSCEPGQPATLVRTTKRRSSGRSTGRGPRAPFTNFLMLEALERDSALRLPHIGEQYVAMALGVEIRPSRLKEGYLGDIRVVQESNVPVFEEEERCYRVERRVMGGFTVQATATDIRARDPRWQPVDGKWTFVKSPARDLEAEGYGT